MCAPYLRTLGLRLFTAAAVTLWLAGAAAAPPQTMGFQGYLTNASSVPVNGSVSVTFRLYSVSSGGSHLWTETQPSVSVANGVYSVILGNVTPINLAFDVPYYLGVTVGGDAEMTPRLPLTSAGYAFRAVVADTAASVSGPVPGAVPWVAVSGSSQLAASNTAYLVTGATLATITLPAAPAVGDIVKVSSPGSGGFTVVPNAGQSLDAWFPRESARSWNSIASSADGAKLAAVVNGGQIYTSTDSGVTWIARESARGWLSIASSDDGTKLAAVVFPGQIWTSADSGVSWTARESPNYWQSIASSADGTKLAAAVSVNGQIWTSADSGVTWTARESPRNWLSIASSADGTKLAAVVNSGQIYISADSGVSWTPRESARAWRSIASSADGTKLAAVVEIGQIWTSADSGVNWTARESVRSWSAIASSADGTKLAAVVESGQIWTSADSGATWTARESARAWRSIASSANGNRVAAVASGGQIYTGFVASLTGGAWSLVELVYVGAGRWILVSQKGSLN